MDHGFLPNGQFQNTDRIDEVVGLDFKLSAAMAFCNPFIPLMGAAAANWSLQYCSEETSRDTKRFKRAISIPESLGSISTTGNSDGSISRSSITRSGSTSSLNSIARLAIRDHILTYTQTCLAAEAPDHQEISGISEEVDETADGMRLLQLLIACAEAVACRDKSHASALLSELRANALVFGSSFQRVASCFVQGLADRLAMVQPFGTVGRNVKPVMNIMDIASSEKKKKLFALFTKFARIYSLATSLLIRPYWKPLRERV